MTQPFRDNAEKQRYEMDEGQGLVFAEYRDGANNWRALTHFQTPVEARGKGAAGRLMAAILEDARASGRKLQARCSYAVDYLQHHPEAGDVLS
jgi:predicted GNAT family acetyltransferase